MSDDVSGKTQEADKLTLEEEILRDAIGLYAKTYSLFFLFDMASIFFIYQYQDTVRS